MEAFKQEVLSLEPFVADSTTVHSAEMSPSDLKAYRRWLAKFKKEQYSKQVLQH